MSSTLPLANATSVTLGTLKFNVPKQKTLIKAVVQQNVALLAVTIRADKKLAASLRELSGLLWFFHELYQVAKHWELELMVYRHAIHMSNTGTVLSHYVFQISSLTRGYLQINAH